MSVRVVLQLVESVEWGELKKFLTDYKSSSPLEILRQRRSPKGKLRQRVFNIDDLGRQVLPYEDLDYETDINLDSAERAAIEQTLNTTCRDPSVDKYRQVYVESRANNLGNPIPESFRGNTEKLCRASELMEFGESENGYGNLGREEYASLPADVREWCGFFRG